MGIKRWNAHLAYFPLGDFRFARSENKKPDWLKLKRDWLKLAGEKIRREQVGSVPTFLCIRANTKFAKLKIGLKRWNGHKTLNWWDRWDRESGTVCIKGVQLKRWISRKYKTSLHLAWTNRTFFFLNPRRTIVHIKLNIYSIKIAKIVTHKK